MSHAHRPLIILTLVAAAACASARVPEMQDTSAMLRFAEMQRRGELDVPRLDCATQHLAVEVAMWSKLLPTRASLNQQLSDELSAHAASVQAGMAAQEESQAALNSSLRSNKGASRAARDGNIDLAVREADRSGAQMSHGNFVLMTRDAQPDGEPLSQEDAEPLVRYAVLRGELSTAEEPGAELIQEVSQLEAEHPEVLPTYARFLLRRYQDPQLRCGNGG